MGPKDQLQQLTGEVAIALADNFPQGNTYTENHK